MRVYNLTSVPFGISNLALRRVKISRVATLNDPFELAAVDLSGREDLREPFRDWKADVSREWGLICFSKSWSNPVLWAHYAANHTGLALGFDVPDHYLKPVEYATAPLKVPIDPITSRIRRDDGFMKELLRTKFSDWGYEDEMRMFAKLDLRPPESGIYFKEFSEHFQLREVILGPRCELSIPQIERIVVDLTPAVSVIKSQLAPGQFKVVPVT